MTEERRALAELFQKSGDGDFLRAVAEAVLQILKRACQRQIAGLPLPVCHWIAIVPTASAPTSTIRRAACASAGCSPIRRRIPAAPARPGKPDLTAFYRQGRLPHPRAVWNHSAAPIH
jgi:hypothetical protein